MAPLLNDIISAAAKDLLKVTPVTPPSGTGQQDTEADIEAKKKRVQAQVGDNAVLSGGVGSTFGASALSLLNKSGNQF